MLTSLYLPTEGLQGEEIPSHVTWENMDFESIKISFQAPLKFKEVYNTEHPEIHDDCIIVKNVEMEGYLGLIFESSKTPAIELHAQVTYSISLSSGQVMQEAREICLFRPELVIQSAPERIRVNPITGSAENQLLIRNVGRGTLILYVDTIEESPLSIATPADQSELLQRIESDFRDEMLRLEKEFPQFQPILEEMFEWEERNSIQVIREERERYVDYMDRLSKAMMSNKQFLSEFLGAYAKVVIKNIEILELMKRFVELYESLISKNILLMNPLDEILVTDSVEVILLRIFQTDRIFNNYEDITLPKIELVGENAGRVPVYNLFGWE